MNCECHAKELLNAPGAVFNSTSPAPQAKMVQTRLGRQAGKIGLCRGLFLIPPFPPR